MTFQLIPIGISTRFRKSPIKESLRYKGMKYFENNLDETIAYGPIHSSHFLRLNFHANHVFPAGWLKWHMMLIEKIKSIRCFPTGGPHWAEVRTSRGGRGHGTRQGGFKYHYQYKFYNKTFYPSPILFLSLLFITERNLPSFILSSIILASVCCGRLPLYSQQT